MPLCEPRSGQKVSCSLIYGSVMQLQGDLPAALLQQPSQLGGACWGYPAAANALAMLAALC